MSRPVRRRVALKGKAHPAVSVLARSAAATHAVVQLGQLRFPCALGRAGCRVRKVEGDGATPIGCWRIHRVLYRPDRLLRPQVRLPLATIRPNAGWCDAPGDPNYNRAVAHPYPASAERLWRRDGLYDVVAVLGYNDRPRVRGKGSAIFVHLARPGFTPTDGCIALSRRDLTMLLAVLSPRSAIVVG